MNKIILSLFILIGLLIPIQNNPAQPKHQKDIDKFEQLEKIKLIELLDLDEQTTLKFFARRNESRSKMKEINDELHKIFKSISKKYKDDNSLNNEEAEKYINRIQELENMHIKEREKFISSLSDLFSKEQILKYIVVENRFRDEVRKKFFNRKNKEVD